MAGASDRARIHLEQSVPELQELRRKNIFTKHEISSIIKKRSDFEYKLNSRGCCPSDHAKYVEYEMNLESLRRRRTKRAGVKVTNYSGQRRIFFILERAVRKFNGDLSLWMQYLIFARTAKSNKKASEILTRMIRMFPTNPEAWIYAANFAMEERGDIREARVYMQKSLRLCKKREETWVEFMRLEMIHVARLAARNKILGLGEPKKAGKIRSCDSINDAGNSSVIASLEYEEKGRTEKHNLVPIEFGAIPMAIFDAAMGEFKHDSHSLWKFFDVVALFPVPSRQTILNHIIHGLLHIAPNHPKTLIRFVQQPTIGLDLGTPEFPLSLAKSLDRMRNASDGLRTMQARQDFNTDVADWATNLLREKDLDSDMRIVIEATFRKARA